MIRAAPRRIRGVTCPCTPCVVAGMLWPRRFAGRKHGLARLDEQGGAAVPQVMEPHVGR